jgi:class 3 adenylate cyclase/tetratricopeptide (TPR) repeat protein
MICPACRHENPEVSKFCLGCGAGLALRCRHCEAELPAGSRFCNQCGGTQAEDSEAAADDSGPERSPHDYTPKHIADKILSQKSAMEGERKQVSVLFADVKSSLDLQQDLDPEEWHGIMDRFFQIIADSIHRFEGTVNQYTGDGIMALFGAPIAHEDHAQRACYAALHLSDALREYARELRRERGLDFSTRIGINSGEVVVGRIGDDLRMDYTAQGHSVGLAARMEALAEPGKTYLTAATASQVKGFFELEDLGEFKVKGITEAVPVFELAGVGALRTRFDVSRSRGLTHFVGRKSELDLLKAALEAAKRGKGRAVGIVANAGVGKSRLCFEFTEHCRATGVAVLQASGVAHGKNIPLLPILGIFRAYFGIDDQDDPRGAREKVAGRLLLIDEGFRDFLPLVFDFLGIPDPDLPAPAIDAAGRQRRLVAIMRSLIERGNPNGFVILIEDLHWVDSASEAFVSEYVDAICGGPGLLVLNFRPEYRADWMNKTWYQQLPLEPLGPEAIREMLDHLLGNDPTVAGLAERIHERTQGNPYFTEEIVRSLVESGTLSGIRGSYRLDSPVESLDVPYSVHAVLSARIDRIAEREKLLLQKAAVIGKEFSESILAMISELPAREFADSLAMLSNAEFIHQQALYPISEYAFAHPLTQEVALGSQLHEQRARTHLAVARALQEADPERVDENAALLAHHYQEAGETLEAARFHARAATWAGTRDLGGTLRHWQQVRELVRSLPDDPDVIDLRLVACLQILVVGGFRMGLSEAAVDEIFAEGSAIAEAVGNDRLTVMLRGAYGARIVGLGRVREYHELIVRNLELSKRLEIPTAGVYTGGCYANFLVGNLEEALHFAAEGVKLTGDDLQLGRAEVGFSYRVFLEQSRSGSLAAMGRLDDARKAYSRTLRIARDSGDRENMGWVLGLIGQFALLTGEVVSEEFGDARTCAIESLRIAEELGSPFSRVVSLSGLGSARLAAEEYEAAERCYGDAIDIARDQRLGLEHEGWLLANRAHAQRKLGRLDAAVTSAEEAVALASERGERVWEIAAQIQLAEARIARDGARARAAADTALTRAEALVRETGAGAYAPLVDQTRANLAHSCGEPEARAQHLKAALAGYLATGATAPAQSVEAALASL